LRRIRVKEDSMAFRLLLVLAAMAALAATVQAGSIVDAFSWVGIYYGSAQLLSPSGTLLSTMSAMTAETQFGNIGPQADQGRK
jgi:hypothetical protein